MSREALALLRGGVAGLLMAYHERLPLRDPHLDFDGRNGATTITTRDETGRPLSRFRVVVDELDLDADGSERPGPTWFAWADVEQLLEAQGVTGPARDRAMERFAAQREFPCPLDPPMETDR